MHIKHMAALALLVIAAQALPAEAHGRKGQRDASIAQLELSEEQQVQLEAIRADFDARAQALREAHRADELAVLSEEQLATLTAYGSNDGERKGRRIDLGLSEEQIDAIKALDATYREARNALKQERKEAVAALLTNEQLTALEALRNAQPPRGQRISLAAQLGLSEEQQTEIAALRTDYAESARVLLEAHRTEEQAVLTADQLAALTAYQDQRHRRGNRYLELGLSDDQISALNDLNATYREARASLQTAHREAVAALLTDEQRALLEALHSAPPFRGMHRGRHGEGHVDADRNDDADESIDGLADGGTLSEQTSESSLLWSDTIELTTAVEDVSWGRIKSDLSE